MSSNTRLLELLTLLHSGRLWPAAELAERLEISPRTLRRDVSTLQELGYPISASRGTGGGYALTGKSALPPLMLSEDEAVVVVLGLTYATAKAADSDFDATVSALVKLMEVLPPKVRRQVEALRSITISSPPGKRRPISDGASHHYRRHCFPPQRKNIDCLQHSRWSEVYPRSRTARPRLAGGSAIPCRL